MSKIWVMMTGALIMVGGVWTYVEQAPDRAAQTDQHAALDVLASIQVAQTKGPILDTGFPATALEQLPDYTTVEGMQLVFGLSLEGHTLAYSVNSTGERYVALAQEGEQFAVVSNTLTPRPCADVAGCLALATDDPELIAAVPEWRTF